MRLSPKPAEFYPVLKPVNLSDFCTGVHSYASDLGATSGQYIGMSPFTQYIRKHREPQIPVILVAISAPD
jgi:hypothetical protein